MPSLTFCAALIFLLLLGIWSLFLFRVSSKNWSVGVDVQHPSRFDFIWLQLTVFAFSGLVVSAIFTVLTSECGNFHLLWKPLAFFDQLGSVLNHTTTDPVHLLYFADHKHPLFGQDSVTGSFSTLTFFISFSAICLLHHLAIILDMRRWAFGFSFAALASLLFCTFVSSSLFHFYIFFEAVLVPMFGIIAIWGSRERKYVAAIYFFIYTLMGSLLILLSLMILYSFTLTTFFPLVQTITISPVSQEIMWWLCFLGLAVKVPMWPFHLWLPEAHVEAPTIGSVMLASLLLKLGGYGFVRIHLNVLNDTTLIYQLCVYTLSMVSVIFASFAAIRQNDMKKIIAYSSVAHMNVVLAGLFTPHITSYSGALCLMVGHGLVSGSLFMLVGSVYERYGSRIGHYYGGLSIVMPNIACLFVFFSFANMGFPLLSNFVGEFLIMLALVAENWAVVLSLFIGFVLCAVYSVLLINRAVFGSPKTDRTTQYSDITSYQVSIYSLSVIGVLFLGVCSAVYLEYVNVDFSQFSMDIFLGNKKISNQLFSAIINVNYCDADIKSSLFEYDLQSFRSFSLVLALLAVWGFVILLGGIHHFLLKMAKRPYTRRDLIAMLSSIFLFIMSSVLFVNFDENFFNADFYYARDLHSIMSRNEFINAATFLLISVVSVVPAFHLLRIRHEGFYIKSIVISVYCLIYIIGIYFSFVGLVLSLELFNIFLFLIAAYRQDDRRALECSLKIFISGGVSSVLLIQGVLSMFVTKGSLDFYPLMEEIAPRLEEMVENPGKEPYFFLGVICIICSFFIKLGLFPFHFWVVEIYRSANYGVMFISSTIAKVVYFFVFFKLMYHLAGSPVLISFIFLVFGCGSVLFSACAMYATRNFKTFLGLSGVGHMGATFVALGQIKVCKIFSDEIPPSSPLNNLSAYTQLPLEKDLQEYLEASSHRPRVFIDYTGFIYAVDNLLAYVTAVFVAILSVGLYDFIVIKLVPLLSTQVPEYLLHKGRRHAVSSSREITYIEDLAVLYRTSPALSFCFIISMFSLAGIPFSLGFYPKFHILQYLYMHGSWLPLSILLISTVVGCVPYLYIILITFSGSGFTKKLPSIFHKLIAELHWGRFLIPLQPRIKLWGFMALIGLFTFILVFGLFTHPYYYMWAEAVHYALITGYRV